MKNIQKWWSTGVRGKCPKYFSKKKLINIISVFEIQDYDMFQWFKKSLRKIAISGRHHDCSNVERYSNGKIEDEARWIRWSVQSHLHDQNTTHGFNYHVGYMYLKCCTIFVFLWFGASALTIFSYIVTFGGLETFFWFFPVY